MEYFHYIQEDFGTVAELMIQKMYELKDSDNLAYDLKTKQGSKIEVKFSRVLKSCKENINFDNAIKSIISSNTENRMLTYENAIKSEFDCNIQQVKGKEFEYLYYGCFFEDKIMICKIKHSEIKTDLKLNYSDHQHRGNNGEGQFHINERTIKHHLNKYLIKWLTYEELYDIFSKKNNYKQQKIAF